MSGVIEDFRLSDGTWARSKWIGGRQIYTIGGQYYKSMLDRCREGPRQQKLYPTYTGCSASFQSAHDFIGWAREQTGYGSGQLDKDILAKGNKLYCPELCVFVPKYINSLLLGRKQCRGDYPIGVRLHAKGRFTAEVSIGGKTKYLGLFDTPGEAFTAYKAAKEAEIKRCAELYRLDLDPRAYDALMQYTVDIND